MDHDRARELAVDEFTRRGAAVHEWDIHGPREMTVDNMSHQWLVFDFVPRPEHNRDGNRFTLQIAVDPRSGRADMLR